MKKQKTIRESYSTFLNVLTTAGVKLNESQKADLDQFILALESKMSDQKKAAVKATKKIVTEHLEAEYKKAFGQVMAHLVENRELAAKLQDKITKINESKKIARSVDNYLNLYVESVLPKKTIVDYDRMQKLEKLHESLKNMLVVDEDAVQAKKAELTESFNKDKKALETLIAKLQVKLNESIDKNLKLNKKIDEIKAVELLESKTADLPELEARRIKKHFAGATTSEINAKFDQVCESVQAGIKEETEAEETSIEEEVKDIIEAEETVKEDDMLTKTPHNGAGQHNAHVPVKEAEKTEKKDDAEELTEEDKEKELDESYFSVNPEQMKSWCASLKRFGL